MTWGYLKNKIGDKRPNDFLDCWQGQYDVFSNFEFAAGISHLLFAVTTLKENGQPNIAFS